MKRINRDSIYLKGGMTVFLSGAAIIVFYMALNYIPLIGQGLGKLIAILSPFVWGLVITYLLEPSKNLVQHQIFEPLTSRMKNRKRAEKFASGFSILLAEIGLIICIAALVYLIIPQLYSSIETIVINGNTYIENLTLWVENVLADYPELEEYATEMLGNVNTGILDWLRNAVLPAAGSLVTNVTSGVYSVVKAVYNLILGMIVSVYLLGKLDDFLIGCRRVIYSIFTPETGGKVLRCIRFTDKTFNGFITGKLLDSLIIGVICYIACAVLRIPYALLVSVVVGVTNIVPFFGPFIGAVPCAVIILMVEPMKCLFFVIMIMILQQLDGNIIGPKILGSSIGIEGIWVMFSIIIGAGLFGFWGMLLGVPVFVVLFTGLKSLVNLKLQSKGLPVDKESYENLDYIDPETKQPVKKEVPEGHSAEPVTAAETPAEPKTEPAPEKADSEKE